MAVPPEMNHDEIAAENDAETDAPTLSLYQTRPGRNVLTEEDNTDGWIATDLTVEVPR